MGLLVLLHIFRSLDEKKEGVGVVNYDWKINDLSKIKSNGKTVFSCFSCGGGSSMGYKLAGFDVIGNVEIDPLVNDCYVENLKPKYNFLMDIRELVAKKELPDELFNLDILDGSPPCTLFSSSNLVADEKKGKEVYFKEGQAKQRLDDLFSSFIQLANRLRPKVVVAENVTGLLHKKNASYVNAIFCELEDAGYSVVHRVLDASKMGVPQKRKRVFFLAIRKDLKCDTTDLFCNSPHIDLDFNEKPILFSELKSKHGRVDRPLPTMSRQVWENRVEGDKDFSDTNQRIKGGEGNSGFSSNYLYSNSVAHTLTTKAHSNVLFDEARYFNKDELLKVATFPSDYDFKEQTPLYITGMSVPPLMTYRLANEINRQWLS